MATKTYKKFADEEVSNAKSKDILDVARQLGMTLKKTGQSYKGEWQGHDTFTFDPRKNRFNWRGRGFGGDTITLYAVLRLGATNEKEAVDFFNTSVKGLNDGDYGVFDASKAPKSKPFSYFLKDRALSREAYQYLEEERNFSRETVDFFYRRGLLVESTWRTTKDDGTYFYEPVLVFKNFDTQGQLIGATVQGIYSYPELHEKDHPSGHLKRIVSGSGSYSGLNLVIGAPKRLVVCEASMDLMAYYELHKEQLQDVRLIAPDGYKPLAYSRYIAEIMGYGHWKTSAKEEYLTRLNKALSKPENSGLFDKKTGKLKTEQELLKSYSFLGATEEEQKNFIERFKKETPLYNALSGFHEHLLHFAYDNDEAGHLFASQFRELYPQLAQFTQKNFPPLHGKSLKNDWNDELKFQKAEQKLASVVNSYRQNEVPLPEEPLENVQEPPIDFEAQEYFSANEPPLEEAGLSFEAYSKSQSTENILHSYQRENEGKKDTTRKLESKLSLSKSLNEKNEEALEHYLKEEFKLYMKPDVYKSYLNLASRFPYFSSDNLRLLFAQNPELSEVRDFNSWKNDYGFSITKGSKAFYIFAPTITSVQDEQGSNLRDDEGKLKTKKGQKLIPVFDRSQTTAPVASLEQGEKIFEQHYAKIYDALVRSSGATIIFQEMPEGLTGRVDVSNGTVFVQRQLGAEATLQIVIDKICEWQMSHKLYNENPQVSASEVSLMGQSMSYMLKKQIGLDTSTSTFDILNQIEPQDGILERLENYLSVVQESAQVLHSALLEGIHSELSGASKQNYLEQLIEQAKTKQAERIQKMQESKEAKKVDPSQERVRDQVEKVPQK